ncbi:hypothetical protein HY992_06445 [Candidatus Micrarchaeota archaeon]|nr:hypothetical protein [Candidatus Micrarchaeota archaeon]
MKRIIHALKKHVHAKARISHAHISQAREKVSRSHETFAESLRQPRSMYLVLMLFFTALAILFYQMDLAGQTWQILAVSALAFFALEIHLNWLGSFNARMKKAVLMGAFLLAFDFLFETSGALFGLWGPRNALLILGAVPIEVMVVTFFGGIAWALYLPRKFDARFSFLDVSLFALFGAFGEWLMIKNNVFYYTGGWTTTHALLSYAFTWIVLHYVNYKISAEEKPSRRASRRH